MTFIIFVGLVLILIAFNQLSNRVKQLEKQLSFLLKNKPLTETKQSSLSEIPRPSSNLSTASLIPRPVPFPTTLPESSFTPVRVASHNIEKSPTEFFLYTWFREHTLIKIGGLFFFLGAVWFVSYAISLGWISPEIRITFGFFLALLTYALGFYRAEVEKTQYIILTALGTGIMCATVSTAQIIFATMFSPVFALGVLALSIAYTAFVALRLKSDSLVILSGVAGLLVPLIIGELDNSLWILLYLLLITTGLLSISTFLNNRLLPLVMVCGVSLFELRLVFNTESNLLWFFVVLLAAISLAGVTITLSRFGRPSILDVFTLLLLGSGFVYFASTIALSAALATFTATFVLGLIGYSLAMKNASPAVISLYSGFTAAGLLLATSFLFSGFSLTLAYIIEITMAFLVVSYLGLPEKVVWIASAAFILPFFGSLSSFTSPAWQTGILHPDALVIYLMAASFIGSAFWLIHKPSIAIYSWSKMMATIFGATGFFYLYGVVAVVAQAVFFSTEAVVMTYLVWSLLSLSLVYYSLRQALPTSVTIYSSLTLLLPLLLSLPSFTSSAWRLGINQPDGLGILGMLVVILLTTLLLIQQLHKEYDGMLLKIIGSLTVIFVSYLFAFFFVLWHGWLVDYSLATIVTYISYALVLYCLVTLFVLLRTSTTWIIWTLITFIIPVAMSLSSFSLSGWRAGVLAPEAIGLFGLTMIFVLLALCLKHRYVGNRKEDLVVMSGSVRGLFVAAFLYAVGLTWSLANTVVAADQAVSLALFIYTVSGLLAYQYGKSQHQKDWRYVGVALLSIVVGRLVLVDVWEMELLYRIVTFLGIGALFIATALFEKKVITENEEKTINL